MMLTSQDRQISCDSDHKWGVTLLGRFHREEKYRPIYQRLENYGVWDRWENVLCLENKNTLSYSHRLWLALVFFTASSNGSQVRDWQWNKSLFGCLMPKSPSNRPGSPNLGVTLTCKFVLIYGTHFDRILFYILKSWNDPFLFFLDRWLSSTSSVNECCILWKTSLFVNCNYAVFTSERRNLHRILS